MPHEYRLVVQSWQCDANGHVNNAVYLNLLESARVDLFRTAGASYRGLRERGFSFVVARICIDYRGQARMEDPLVVVTEPIRRRAEGAVFSQKVFREDTAGRALVAEAEVTWACLDASGRPTRLPGDLEPLFQQMEGRGS